jgi:hypothetical protein
MMLRGKVDGVPVNNTTPVEIEALLSAYKRIQPAEVMLYSLDRKTPVETLKKIEKAELEVIAAEWRKSGINVLVS